MINEAMTAKRLYVSFMRRQAKSDAPIGSKRVANPTSVGVKFVQSFE
jgi:hypothetical protein